MELCVVCRLIVDAAGEIEGNVLATRAIISGAISGSIHATEILVRSTARINGDIFYQRIHIEEGAEVNGQLRKMAAQQVPAETQCETKELVQLPASPLPPKKQKGIGWGKGEMGG